MPSRTTALAPATESSPNLSADLRRNLDAQIENVLINGDLRNLEPAQRVSYYRSLCQSLGLNPLTKPFDYITLSGRLTLYAKKDATDQLRAVHGVSITAMNATVQQVSNRALYIVTAHASDRAGRTDVSTGSVSLGANMSGDDLANAMMKAETKAKRRVTLSICGLGLLDESELHTMREVETNANGEVRRATVNLDTGDIVDTAPQAETPQAAPQAPAPAPQAATARPRREGPSNEERSAEDGLVRVTRFRVGGRGTNARGAWTRYLINFSDGVEATTFNDDMARIAREAGESGNPVEVQVAQSRNGRGVDLVSIEPFFSATIDETDPITGEVIEPSSASNDDDIIDDGDVPF